MRIGNNISAMNTLNRLTVNSSQLSKSLEKLSSGSAINRAADDAAGLAISEKMKAQIAGLEQASKNAQDGISLVQTAEGALDQTHTALRRMETLAMKAKNGTITAEDRAKIQAEVDARTNEIDRVAKTTNFNGIRLFDGSLAGPTEVPATPGVPGVPAVAAVAPTATAGAEVGSSTTTAGAVSFEAGSTAARQNALITALETDGIDLNLTQTTAAGDTIGVTGSAGYTYTALDAGGAATTVAADMVSVEISDATGVIGTFAVAVAGSDTDGTINITFAGGTAGSDAVPAVPATPASTSLANAAAPTAPAAVTLDTGLTATMSNVTFADANADGANNNLIRALTDTGISFTKTVNGAGNVTGISASLSGYTFSAIDNTSTAAQTITISRDGAAVGTVSLTLSANASTIATGTAGTVTANAFTGGTLAANPLELQIGASAEAADKISVAIAKMDSESLLGAATLDMSTPDAAQAAITRISAAIELVSEQRANLGATQNRLEQTIENLSTTAENMSAAESRIRDVDMAKEMTNFTKNSILSQASQAMLAQANSLPQGVLQLLK